jgi:intracellular sulfur oxidation DsrE/DsrF family protein
MGTAEKSLQHRLIRTYLRLLDEHNMLPAAICFYLDGVKMVVRDSPALGELKSLEAKGVHLVVCNTCLNHFGLADEVQVGVVGGMTDIMEAQWQAEKVITI